MVNPLVALRLYLKSEMSLVSRRETATTPMAHSPSCSSSQSCCTQSVSAESHSALFLCCKLPSALHEMEEGAQPDPDWKVLLFTYPEFSHRKVWSRALPGFLPVLLFQKATLCSSPALGTDIRPSGFWVLLWGRLCKNVSKMRHNVKHVGGKRLCPLSLWAPMNSCPGHAISVCCCWRWGWCLPTLLAFAGLPKPRLVFIGILCLYSTSRVVGKVFNKRIGFIPFRKRKHATEVQASLRWCVLNSSGFTLQYPRGDIFSFSQNMGRSWVTEISLQLVLCFSFLVFSCVISASGRM